jgi:integrase
MNKRKHRPPKVSLYTRSDSPWWWVRSTFKGVRNFEPLSGLSKNSAEDRDRAKRIAADLQEQLLRKFYGVQGDEVATGPTLAEVFDLERTRLKGEKRSQVHQDHVDTRLKNIQALLGGGDRPASSITKADIRALRYKLAEGRSQTTLHHYLATLKAAFAHAVDEEVLAAVPFGELKVPAQIERDEVVPPAALRKIVDGADPKREEDRAIMLARFSALRLGDLQVISWEMIDWGTAVLRRKTKKRGVTVEVPLTPELLAWLKPAKQPGGLIFNPPQRDRSSLLVRRLEELTGEHYTVHQLRHTLLTDLARAGINPRVIQSIAGHKTLAQTLNYIKRATLAETREAVKVLQFRPPQEAAEPVEKKGH